MGRVFGRNFTVTWPRQPPPAGAGLVPRRHALRESARWSLPGFPAVGTPLPWSVRTWARGWYPVPRELYLRIRLQGLVVSASAVGAVCDRRRGLQQGGCPSAPSTASPLTTCAKRLVFSDPGPGMSLCQAPGHCRKTRPEHRCAHCHPVSLLLRPQRGERGLSEACSRSTCLHRTTSFQHSLASPVPAAPCPPSPSWGKQRRLQPFRLLLGPAGGPPHPASARPAPPQPPNGAAEGVSRKGGPTETS